MALNEHNLTLGCSSLNRASLNAGAQLMPTPQLVIWFQICTQGEAERGMRGVAVVTRCVATVSASLRGSALLSSMSRAPCGVTSSVIAESEVLKSETLYAGVLSMGRRSCHQANKRRPTETDT